jgi:anti-sigma B factor antagonist
MTLTIRTIEENQIVTLVLQGDVDTKTAPELLEVLTTFKLKELSELKIDLAEVNFMSSAGLRALIFAKQKMNHDSIVSVVNSNDEIKDVIIKTGLSNAVSFINT